MIAPAQMRARYEGSGSYVADALTVRPSQLAVRSFNFGQHWRTPGLVDVAYVVTLPAQFFVDILAAELPEYVDDSRRFPDDNDPFENALRHNGWPQPREIRDTPELALMALEWCSHDLLLAWFGDGEPTDSPGFVINSIDSVDFSGPDPRITGAARAAGIPVRYQDV